jgi:hypothetical protein
MDLFFLHLFLFLFYKSVDCPPAGLTDIGWGEEPDVPVGFSMKVVFSRY